MGDAELAGVESLVDTIDELKARWTESAAYIIGTGVRYAVYVEYGTSKMRAQPYLRPAIETVRRKLPALARDADTLSDLVDEAAQMAERVAKRVVPVDTGHLKSSIRTIEVGPGQARGRTPDWA